MSAGTFFRTVGGQYSQALGMHEIALVCVLALEGHDSPGVAASYNNIGVVYRSQGQYERALEYHQKALEIFIKVSGQDHPDVAASYNNIGEVYRNQGKYDEALEMYTKSLDIKTRIYGGDNHLDVAASYNNMGPFTTAKASTRRRWSTIGNPWISRSGWSAATTRTWP